MSAPQRHRWGRWAFIALQVLFVIWLISGLASTTHGTDCGQLSQHTCDSANNVGRAIGVFLIVALWAIVDVIIGVTVFVLRRTRKDEVK